MAKDTSHIDFWNSEKEVGEFLASLIKLTKARTVLEVGVFQGNTSMPMIEALPMGGYYVGIDIEDLRLDQNIKGWKKDGCVVDFIEASSHKALEKLPTYHFDLIFVDAAHHWDHILPEWKLVEKLLGHGGVIVYHDSMHIADVNRLMVYAMNYGWESATLKTPELRGLTILSKNL
jgi:O-methyltransferase